MTLLAPSAPLVTVAHDWTAPVERVTSYPSRVLVKFDGSEQRQSLSHLATSRVTYRVIAPASSDAVALNALPTLAANTLVRIPRWEDQSRVSAGGATAGVATLPCDTTGRPTFVSGAQVMIWRSPSQYEVCVIGTVSSSSIGTVDPLASNWAADSIVVPISEGRLVLPLGMTHWAPTSGVPQLTVDLSVRDLAGIGTGGTAVAGVPYAIDVTDEVLALGGRTAVTATVTDAAGNELSGDGIVWTSSQPVDVPIYASGDPRVAIATNPASAWYFSITATATIGAVSGSGTVFIST